MALTGVEWLAVIVLVLILVLLLRPSTVTDVARSLGRAASEFRGGQKSSFGRQPPSDELKQVALSLGISVEGKSAEQLSDEIARRK